VLCHDSSPTTVFQSPTIMMFVSLCQPLLEFIQFYHKILALCHLHTPKLACTLALSKYSPVLPLTPCRWVTRKLVIALPCIVDGSRVSSFSYTKSCTCVCQLVWLTYHFKFMDSLMQDVWVSSYK
jgi:hypothetical protein